MAYRGSRILSIRINEERERDLIAAMNSANLTRREEPYTLSTWIMAAIDEKIDHPRRAKKQREANKLKRKKGASENVETVWFSENSLGIDGEPEASQSPPHRNPEPIGGGGTSSAV